MNVLEYEMIETLKKLKDLGVFEIKAEYEAEGSRQVELMRLKDLIEKVDLPLIIKTGGPEAISNMYEALTLGVKGIVAPMCETAYATSKFLDGIEKFIPEDNRKDIEFAVNIETITAFNNFDEILNLKNINVLSSITVGRVDFTGSLNKGREFANTDAMLYYCESIFKKSKAIGLKTALGGEISVKAKDFIQELINQNLLDKYETRKLVYKSSAIDTIDEGLVEGVKFELQWLKSKQRYYHLVATEDSKRIEMLEKRLNG